MNLFVCVQLSVSMGEKDMLARVCDMFLVSLSLSTVPRWMLLTLLK